VPNVAAADVRIPLRVGNEREERAIEFPQSFRIEPGVASLDLAEVHATLTDAAGESALPASPPVIEWVSGDRRGAGLVTSRHRDAARVHGHDVSGDITNGVVIHLSNISSLRPAVTSAGIIRSTSSRVAQPIGEPRPLLLLLTRLNV
jgi:hypothetical protein